MSRSSLGWMVSMVLVAGCGGSVDGPHEDGGANDAWVAASDAGGRADAVVRGEDSGAPDAAGTVNGSDVGVAPDDVGTADDASMPSECPVGMAGPSCSDCAPGYQDVDADGVCTLGCDATGMDALDCGVGGSCFISPISAERECLCDDGYGGDRCETCSSGYARTDDRCELDLPPTSRLVVWLDADAEATVAVGSGGAVASWADRRPGRTPELTQTVASARPARIAGARNGRAAIRFDGGDQLFVNGSFALATDDYEIIVAASSTASGTHGLVSFAADTSLWGVMLDAVNEDFTLTHRSPPAASGGLTSTVNRATSMGATWVSASHQSSASPHTIALFAGEGSAEVMQVTPVTSAGVGEALTLRVGRTQGGFLEGDVYEVLVYTRRLSVAERAEVVAYLRAKWAL